MPRCTITRLAAVHLWPEALNAGPEDALDRQVRIGVVQDDDRVLTAELDDARA